MANFAGGTITVGTTAAQFASVPSTREIYLRADMTNTGVISVGGSAVQAFKLQAGDTLYIEVTNLNTLWGKASAAGQVLNYIIVN